MKGLNTDFKIENGKFKLAEGKEKADNEVTMLVSFFNYFRIFAQDFCVNHFVLAHKSFSAIKQYETSFKLQLKDVMNRYLPAVNFVTSIFYKNAEEKNKVYFSLEYSYTENTTETNTFEFVRV